MAGVDSVQSSNTGAYTIGGAALGAIGGGAYGYFSKPYLEKDAPSDTFFRTVAEKALEAEGEAGAAKKAEIAINEAIVNAKDADALAAAKADQYLLDGNKSLSTLEGEAKEAKFASEKTAIKERLSAIADDKLANKAELIKKVEDAKAFDEVKEAVTAINKAAIEVTEGGFDTAKKTATEALNGKAVSFVDEGKKLVGEAFDSSKKEFKLDGVAENAKKSITETISSMKTKAALKWAGIAAVALGVIGFIVGKCTSKSYPVASAKLDEQA